MSQLKRQHGFTLVELMLAMAIFSFMSLILATGIVRLFQIYQAGTAIRVSQQSARTVAEQVSRDARTASVIGVGSGPAGAPDYSTICLMQPTNITTGSAGTEDLSGPVYFVYGASGYGYSPASQVSLYEESLQFTVTAATPGPVTATDIDTACGASRPASITGATRLSSADTSVEVLAATETSSSLLSLKLGVAAMSDLGSIASVNLANGVLCNGGVSARYCSATNMAISVNAGGGS